MGIILLSLAVLISAIIAIFYKQKEDIKMYSIFKPLTTILILCISILSHKTSQDKYSTTIILAIFFSLIGDIFLISKRLFLPGLFAFLIAHIVFTISFANLFGFCWNIKPLIIIGVIAISYFLYLKRDLKRFKIPVAIYITIIVVMSWQAIGLLFNDTSIIYVSIAIASILFFFSDSILAYKRFKRPFKSAEILILSTYWIAIYIFAMMGLFIKNPAHNILYIS